MSIGLVDERVETIPVLAFLSAISIDVTPINGPKNDPITNHLRAFLFFTPFFTSPHFPLMDIRIIKATIATTTLIWVAARGS